MPAGNPQGIHRAQTQGAWRLVRAYLGFDQVVCVGEGDSIKKILMSEDDWVEGELRGGMILSC